MLYVIEKQKSEVFIRPKGGCICPNCAGGGHRLDVTCDLIVMAKFTLLSSGFVTACQLDDPGSTHLHLK